MGSGAGRCAGGQGSGIGGQPEPAVHALLRTGGMGFNHAGEARPPCVFKVQSYGVGQKLLIMLQRLFRGIHGVQPAALGSAYIQGEAFYLIKKGASLHAGRIHDEGKAERNEQDRGHESHLQRGEPYENVLSSAVEKSPEENAEDRPHEYRSEQSAGTLSALPVRGDYLGEVARKERAEKYSQRCGHHFRRKETAGAPARYGRKAEQGRRHAEEGPYRSEKAANQTAAAALPHLGELPAQAYLHGFAHIVEQFAVGLVHRYGRTFGQMAQYGVLFHIGGLAFAAHQREAFPGTAFDLADAASGKGNERRAETAGRHECLIAEIAHCRRRHEAGLAVLLPALRERRAETRDDDALLRIAPEEMPRHAEIREKCERKRRQKSSGHALPFLRDRDEALAPACGHGELFTGQDSTPGLEVHHEAAVLFLIGHSHGRIPASLIAQPGGLSVMGRPLGAHDDAGGLVYGGFPAGAGDVPGEFVVGREEAYLPRHAIGENEFMKAGLQYPVHVALIDADIAVLLPHVVGRPRPSVQHDGKHFHACDAGFAPARDHRDIAEDAVELTAPGYLHQKLFLNDDAAVALHIDKSLEIADADRRGLGHAGKGKKDKDKKKQTFHDAS